MKRTHYLSAFAAIMMAFMALCGNAGAQNTTKANSTEPKLIIELTSEQFKELVYDIEDDNMTYLGNKPAIVDFMAYWCQPCRNIEQILKELAIEYKDRIVIYKVNIEKCPDIAEAFDIQMIPAVLYIPLDGDPSITIGARSKAKFQEEINKILLGK